MDVEIWDAELKPKAKARNLAIATNELVCLTLSDFCRAKVRCLYRYESSEI